MKKQCIILSVFISCLGLIGGMSRCNAPQRTLSTTEQVKRKVSQDLDSLQYLVDQMLLPLAQQSTATDTLQQTFYRCRVAYKKIEFATEYFMPATSRLVNGPPLDEIETGEYEVNEPGGLQVIEEFLFPAFDTAQRGELVREVKKLKSHLVRIETLWEAGTHQGAHVFDAMRLQMVRIISLGISGFDTPLSKRAMPEAAASLAAMQACLRVYDPGEPAKKGTYDVLQRRLTGAVSYLKEHSAFDSFDRMHFITTYANPIAVQLLALQRQSGYPPFTELRALRADAPTVFAPDAFNTDFYAPNPEAYTNKDKIVLGRMLFYDPVLSSNNSRSCATCHQPEKAFTDGLPTSAAFAKGRFIKRNAPTLLNAGLQRNQFYDMRSTTLEHQAMDVVQNKEEMHGSLEKAIGELYKQPAYIALFRKAFPAGDSIRPVQIQNAIASYIRSLVSLNSRFDQYVRGDRTRMSSREILGFNVFMGKAKCGTCHFMPLFNGTVPPAFDHTEGEVLGVPADAKGKQLDEDLGRYAVHPFDQFKHAFKTPTVRNVALTAPYMHNGVYRTLEEVIDFYNKGGGTGLGLDVPNQTLPAEPLNLTQTEKQALVAFMQTLTDTTAADPTVVSAAVASPERIIRPVKGK